MDDDHTLLSRFAKAKDERAFTELVRRHLDMVHGVCLRRTGNRPLAEELVQNVFASLARKAGSLKPEVLVVGWLHRAAHFESLSAFRSESSRLRKMKEFMDFQPQTEPEPNSFREISPFLDQALDALPTPDRDVVLLRFASDLTLQQIGHRLGKSESAAQRHLQRVLDKLAVILRRRGVTTSATALALMLGADFAKAAPASLTVAFVSKTAIASAAASGFSIVKITTILYIMKNKAIIIASVCLLAAGGSVAYISTRPSASLSSSSSAAIVTKDSATNPGASSSKDLVSTLSEETAKKSASSRSRPVSEYHDLEEKFGASRVRLAKNVTDNFLKVTEGLIKAQEFQLSQEADGDKKDKRINFNFSSGNGSGDSLSSVTGLTLSEEQKTKVKAMNAKQTAKAIDACRAMQARFRENRTDVMELLLSSDASMRGEMSAGNYQTVLDQKKEMLRSIGETQPDACAFHSEAYRTELPSILDADQMAVFEKFRSEQTGAAAAGCAKKRSNPLNLRMVADGPNENAQTLEQVDEETRKMVVMMGGLVKMLDAAGGN
jgi:RNA polymerase sigma factor (sigma-70 family)